MKTLLVALTLFVSTAAQAGLYLTCDRDDNLRHDLQPDHHFVLFGESSFVCRDENLNPYVIEMIGGGLGLRDVSNSFAGGLACPTLNRARLERKGRTNLVGIHVGLDLGFGAQARAALNHRGESCFLTGADFWGLGASVGVESMRIFTADGYRIFTARLPGGPITLTVPEIEVRVPGITGVSETFNNPHVEIENTSVEIACGSDFDAVCTRLGKTRMLATTCKVPFRVLTLPGDAQILNGKSAVVQRENTAIEGETSGTKILRSITCE